MIYLTMLVSSLGFILFGLGIIFFNEGIWAVSLFSFGSLLLGSILGAIWYDVASKGGK